MTATRTEPAAQADAWEELRTTALLGTDRRPLPAPAGSPALVAAATAVDRTDPATALLELAALTAVRRRAGARPGAVQPAGPAAPADPRPELPVAAARRLTVLLDGRSGSAGGTLANLTELLPQWLATARARGLRPPAALLPALLDSARARSELRGDAVALAGPLGRWLAERNPDWRFVLRTVTDAAGTGDPAVPTSTGDPTGTGDPGAVGDRAAPGDEHRIWHEGLFAERVTHLTRLRRTDPAAGLDLLRGTWTTERAEDRLLFLDALQDGLSPADEPFLEAALGDRSKNVRATAAELLSTLAGSALATRMAERARAAVRLAGTGRALLVTPPSECDAAMQRDGVAPKSPTGRGERAWWFGEIVAATPLRTWTDDTGLTPARLLGLPVGDAGPDGSGTDPADGTWTDDLREGWARAAVRQHDADWARALLGPAPRPGRDGRTARTAGAPAKLLAVLPAPERAAWTAAFIQAHGLGEAFQLLGACATPWTPPLSTAVVAALERAASSGTYPWSHSGVLGMTERALAPEAAPAVEALASDAAPDTAWAETFARLAGTLRFRAAMLAELDV
ncbi:hypothetical protein GCM10010495_24140 [Kitasatospora herbaricolor]|uniref:DUF5691 domain-containing protein n=1 Tax=Kitasatospora herbaricolor TaxID=68217 RepID=UPI00174AE9EE|nr:DUF5691 domain-containing protein [Kitasatospora herbaricolor]MDQ0308803.1 hypothetical protein [Kitasatospora herbaricolor]GGV10126.1 hypothetical protein GCM10010495_24140 [Kitasatospora herbaricolor]